MSTAPNICHIASNCETIQWDEVRITPKIRKNGNVEFKIYDLGAKIAQLPHPQLMLTLDCRSYNFMN